MKLKKVKCPYCSAYFKFSHLCRMENSGKTKDFCITRKHAISKLFN